MACVICTSALGHCARGDWRLSDRELEVLRLICAGHTNVAIAQCLNVKDRTAQSHVARLLLKTGTANRTQLAVCALRRGVVSLTDCGCGSDA